MNISTLGCLSGARYGAGFERNSGVVPGDSIPAAFWEPVKVFVLIDGAFGELLLVGAGKPGGCGEQELGGTGEQRAFSSADRLGFGSQLSKAGPQPSLCSVSAADVRKDNGNFRGFKAF